jgi:hypothetical protein
LVERKSYDREFGRIFLYEPGLGPEFPREGEDILGGIGLLDDTPQFRLSAAGEIVL